MEGGKFKQVEFVIMQFYFRSQSILCFLGPNSPGPLMDDWKVTDDSSVNFHDMFFFIFCQIIAKNEEKHVMEIYG